MAKMELLTVYNLNKYLNLNGISSSIYSFNDATTKVEDFKEMNLQLLNYFKLKLLVLMILKS